MSSKFSAVNSVKPFRFGFRGREEVARWVWICEESTAPAFGRCPSAGLETFTLKDLDGESDLEFIYCVA